MSLEALAKEYWETGLEASPIGATALGDRRWDHLMPDLSVAARAAYRQSLEDFQERCQALDPEDLQGEERVTQRELLATLDRELDVHAVDLDSWNVCHMTGPQVLLQQIPDLQPLRSASELEAYLGRVRAIPGYLAQCVEALRLNLSGGRIASAWPVRRTIGQLEATLARPAEEWPLGRHLGGKVEGVDAETMEASREDLVQMLEERVRPALGAYLAVLRDEVQPFVRDEEHAGISFVEGGPDDYRKLIGFHTSLKLSAEEIHRIGEEEVERLHGEICALGEKIFATGEFAAIQEHLRSDPSLHYSTSEQVLEAATGAISRAEQALPEYFNLFPETTCAVEPIPAEEAPDATIGYYRGPSADGSRPGKYYINTYAPETRARFEAEVLAFHEAVPGHHLQISVAQRLEGLPAFRRHGGVTAYIEGWALYSESLAEEMGLYSGDLERLGAMFFDVKRACRLVVDTGLHALQWSRQRCIDYMVKHSLMSGDAVEVEVDRFTVLPGQALSYKLGQLEVRRLRTQAEEALGEKFSLKGFHDQLLCHGAVSLSVLEQLISRWISEVGATS
jgi:uncharacterized protein (DUF885 family)